MKKFVFILFILIAIALGVGFYFKFFKDNDLTGDKIIGIAILVSTFVLMPLFLYTRWRGKHLKDYTLTPENIKRMREKGLD